MLAQAQGSIPFELRARLDLEVGGSPSDRLAELVASPGFLEAAGVAPDDPPPPSR